MYYSGEFKLVMYPVGQGLFQSLNYLPNFRHGSCRPFHMVYDCGTSRGYWRHGERAVTSFITYDLRDEPYLDLLVISHLHWDHVSLLPTLLSRVSARKVVLPYLTPCERLYELMTEFHLYPNWYVRFIADPVSFLLNLGVEEVLLVGEGEEGAQPPVPPGSPGEFPPSEDIGTKMREMKGEWAALTLGKSAGGRGAEDPSRLDGSYTDADEFRRHEDVLSRHLEVDSSSLRVKFLTMPIVLVFGCGNRERGHLIHVWPFLRKPGLGDEEHEFMEEVSDLLRDCGIRRRERIIDDQGRCHLRSSEILGLMGRRDCITRMRELYSKYLKRLNEHSLVALVNAIAVEGEGERGCTRFRASARCLGMNEDKLRCYRGRFNPDIPLRGRRGFLFTGDLSARGGERSRIFSQLVGYYGKDTVSNLSYYQAPHHGSSNGWDRALDGLESDLSAVSYGCGNNYNHPHREHMDWLHGRSRHLVEVNERRGHLIGYWILR